MWCITDLILMPLTWLWVTLSRMFPINATISSSMESYVNMINVKVQGRSQVWSMVLSLSPNWFLPCVGHFDTFCCRCRTESHVVAAYDYEFCCGFEYHLFCFAVWSTFCATNGQTTISQDCYVEIMCTDGQMRVHTNNKHHHCGGALCWSDGKALGNQLTATPEAYAGVVDGGWSGRVLFKNAYRLIKN